MTLYTTMPLELVLKGYEDDVEPTQEVWVSGIKMQVVPIAADMGKIVRLLECSLNDYLNPSFTPGSIVRYQSTPN